MYETLVLSVFPLLIMLAGISDYFTLTIPNWINTAIALSVIPFVLLSGMPVEVFAWHVAAGVMSFLVGYYLFSANLIGGGDAKMLAACGLWIGWSELFQFAFYTAIAGGFLAITVGLWSRLAEKSEDGAGVMTAWMKKFRTGDLQLPYGIAIAAGGVVIFPATWWVQQLT